MTPYDVQIVGAGLGGAQAASALGQSGFDGSIAMIGEEPELPYQRPPLSTDSLSGEKRFQRILMRPPAFRERRSVTSMLRERVIALDPESQTVTTTSSAKIGYGSPIWATGRASRKLASNQYDIKLQTVGRSVEYDAPVVRGLPDGRSLPMIDLKECHVMAMSCVNATKDDVQGRQLVLDRLLIDPVKLVHTSVPRLELLLQDGCIGEGEKSASATEH